VGLLEHELQPRQRLESRERRRDRVNFRFPWTRWPGVAYPDFMEQKQWDIKETFNIPVRYVSLTVIVTRV
jgi:hypothetical protein